jgi:arylsulfatase
LGIKAKNEFRNQPGHLIDIMATCIDVAGATFPESFNGNIIAPYEGVSLTSTFRNEELQNKAIFWEHEGNKAIRLGNYKLVSKWEKESEYNWELYDLELDRSETNNLIERLPEKATEMELLWKEWANKVGALTWSSSQEIEQRDFIHSMTQSHAMNKSKTQNPNFQYRTINFAFPNRELHR